MCVKWIIASVLKRAQLRRSTHHHPSHQHVPNMSTHTISSAACISTQQTQRDGIVDIFFFVEQPGTGVILNKKKNYTRQTHTHRG